jgi:hypothetical protein
VGWLISTHDIYGRLARGLTEKSVSLLAQEFDVTAASTYVGALSPQQVLAKLLQSGLSLRWSVRLNNSLWRADLGSIPTLRWLLPIISILNQMILIS